MVRSVPDADQPTQPIAWSYAAGRLSRQLSSEPLPLGRHTAAQAAKGVQMPSGGVPVVHSLALADLSLPEVVVVVPTGGSWSSAEARLVSAHVAVGRHRCGDERGRAT